MAMDTALLETHAAHCARAAEIYRRSNDPQVEAEVWKDVKRVARGSVETLLEQSDQLLDIRTAIQSNAGGIGVLRRILAPPLSQDQLKIHCPAYNKGAENAGRAIASSKAEAIAAVLAARLDRELAPWLDEHRAPDRSEREQLIVAATALISVQTELTERRRSISEIQEKAVIDLLIARGWDKLPARPVSTLTALSSRQFMHKVKFATTTQPQEVDIACGLGQTVVLALECKVSNDVTNSIKRINDVVKKAVAWKAKWGDFVRTAALLQGVLALKDVGRLLESGVIVFWSHDLPAFEAWLDAHMKD
jgi:hypothetical protein